MNLIFARVAAVVGATLGGVLATFADEGFTPVFYGAHTGDMAPFEGLSVFRDAIPSYAISGVMKPRIRPFTKHNEYPKQYVQRIPDAERRTTPYNVTDLFAHPEKNVDSDYAKSGRPFFIYERVSRPPYFLPSDGCPLADRAAFSDWKKSHPGFLGFNSLWELDSDTSYFTYFWTRIPDASLAQDLHAGFEPPHAKGRGHLTSWVKEIFRRGRDFHWGEERVWPMCSNHMGFEHLFAANGAAGLWYEATTQSIGAWNCAGAFVRGAARQWGLRFGWYMAQYFTGFSRSGKALKGDSRWYDPKDPDKPCVLRYRGEGRSQHRRQALYGWLIGASYLQTEGWGSIYRDWKDGRIVPSENAVDFNEIYELSKKVECGEPFTPLAVLTPLAEPSSSGYNNQDLLEPETQRTIFDTLVPIRGDGGEKRPDRRKGETGCLYNSAFAGFFDALCPDAGQDSAAFAKALARYRYVLVAGQSFDRTKFDQQALEAFKRGGGKVITYPGPGCETPEALRTLLLKIQDETMPVRVAGDVQWLVNRTSKGWLVALVNNKGVVKFVDEPEEFDLSKTANVTVTLKATGETRTVSVKPGDFALLEFKVL